LLRISNTKFYEIAFGARESRRSKWADRYDRANNHIGSCFVKAPNVITCVTQDSGSAFVDTVMRVLISYKGVSYFTAKQELTCSKTLLYGVNLVTALTVCPCHLAAEANAHYDGRPYGIFD
jgi:hypothetical protein